MKTKIYSFLTAGLLILAGACTDDWQPRNAEQGTLQLSSLGIQTGDENAAEQKSAPSRSDVDTDNFIITIYDSHGLTQDDWQWTFAKMPEVIRLPAATGYRVVVESHEIKPAAWSEPYFIGSETFDIEQDKITRLGTILCYFNSLKVTVEFTEAFKKRASADTKAIVFRDETPDKLEYLRDETRSGYFQHPEGPTTVVTILNATLDGNPTTKQHVYKVDKPGSHLIVTYDVEPIPPVPSPTGTSNPSGIVLDVQFEIEGSSNQVAVEEDPLPSNDRPGQETPEKPDEPKPAEAATFEPVGVVLNQDNILKDGMTAVVNISCPEGFEKLEVNIDSETLSPADLEDVGLAANFDLCAPGDLKETIDRLLKIDSGSAIKGQTTMKFDVSDLVGLLAVLGNGRSTFNIKVTDSKGAVASTKLIIVVQ